MPDESYVLDILDSLVHVGRPILLQYFSLDSCISSSNVARQVLWSYHIYAEAYPVKMAAYNAKGDEFMRAKAPEKVREQVDGAYSVGAGFGGPNPAKWDGHLVLVVDHRFLLDMSADQASRPGHDLLVTPFFGHVDGMDFSKEKAHVAFALEKGGVLTYESAPSNQSFRRAPDWQRPYRDVVRDVSRAVAQDLLRRRRST